MRLWRTPASVLVTLAVLAGLATGSLEAAEKLTISASQTALLVWLAHDRGYFKDEGLDVDVKRFQSGLASADALINGDAELSTTSDSAFVSRSLKHPDLRILAAISTIEVSRLVGRRDRNVIAAKDLAARRIGVTVGSTGEFLLGRYLTLNGLSLSDVEIVNMKPAAIEAALVSGEIDAGLTWVPYIYRAEAALGQNAVRLPDQEGQFFYFLLLGKADWIKSNAETTRAVLRALLRAEQLVIDQGDVAKRHIADMFNHDPTYMDHLWPLHSLRVSLPRDLLFFMEEQARWRIRKGLTMRKSVPNYLELIDTKPLRALRSDVVGIQQ